MAPGASSTSRQLFERARLLSAAGAARWPQAIFDEIRTSFAPLARRAIAPVENSAHVGVELSS
ncbi:hypothetical protein [Sorangium sp. So ce854]|uniref:hypothetical protein n=1 Tax=Sorangium sp. So ce854 TaxID=3133322 RepID=UPI003F5ED7CF